MSLQGLGPIIKAEHLTTPSTAPVYELGQKVISSGNEYVYVYAGSAIAAGNYTVLQGIANSFTSGYTVTVTNASQANWLAGVAQVAFNAADYGFIMTRGVSVGVPDSGAVSLNVGVDLALGTDGGFVAAAVTFSTAPRVAVTMNSFVTTVGTGKIRLYGSIL